MNDVKIGRLCAFRLHKTFLVLTALVLGMALVSCSSASGGEVTGSWILTSMEVDGSALDLEGLSTASIPEAPAWISFDSEGELKGEGNCSDFSASYEMCGGILRVGLVWMPVNMCQENREVESAVIGMLFEQELDVAFSDGGETLELAAERTRAVFTRR